MICGNCGFQNAPGDEFCGSCGQFLAWTGQGAQPSQGGAGPGASGAPAGPAPSGPAPASLPPAGPPPAGPAPMPPGPAPAGPDSSSVVPVAAAGASANAAPLDASPAWSANLQRCDVCGTANELSRTFCLNCGAKLKRAGTVGGVAAVAAARGTGKTNWRPLLYLLGGAAIFLVFAAVAFAALGGFGRGNPPAVPGSTPTLVANLPSPSSPVTSPVASLPIVIPGSAGPSDTPLQALPSASVPAQTSPPASVPVATPPTGTPTTGFSCDNQHLDASGPGGWRVAGIASTRSLRFDQLAITLNPISGTETAGVDAALMSFADAQTTTGLNPPTGGDVALVLSFSDAVTSGTPQHLEIGYRALHDASYARSNGIVYVVIGVNGTGCFSLVPHGWDAGATSPAELDVDVQR